MKENCLIYGLGESGISAICKLKDDYNIYIYDDNFRKTDNAMLMIYGINRAVKLDKDFLLDIKLIVVSPSIPIDNKYLVMAKSLGIKIVSELELGYMYGNKPIISITGSNGKTTTTKFIEHIFQQSGKSALAVGNVGVPICSIKKDKYKYLICEVSSFQLEHCDTYKSHIACFLNISQNHLDRHKTFEEYFFQKTKLFKNMDRNDIAILNYDDRIVCEFSPDCKKFYFSISQVVKGAYLKNNALYINIRKPKLICKCDDINLKGLHNIQNILAGSLACYFAGIKISKIRQGIKTFSGLPHRLEYVDTINGTEYYNDSKSTTDVACLTATRSFDREIVLLIGGSPKGIDYTNFFKELNSNVKYLIMFGNIRNKLEEDYKISNCNIPYLKVQKMSDAVIKAKKIAKIGQVVLLSPATASFDEFNNYIERGEKFCKLVKELKNEEK